MAQWRRQFTGETHQTEVEDRERQLRHAICVSAMAESPADRLASMQTIGRLAERLHRARIRVLKARIASLDPRDTNRIDAAHQKLGQLVAGGVVLVLREFNATIELD